MDGWMDGWIDRSSNHVEGTALC